MPLAISCADVTHLWRRRRRSRITCRRFSSWKACGKHVRVSKSQRIK